MNSTSAALDLDTIKSMVSTEINHLNEIIATELDSSIPLIKLIINHILKNTGKRIRPLLVILCANACEHTQPSQTIELAAIIEFIHTATLLHDDVVDESDIRRGKQTANTIWGDKASILIGDFLYSRAFQILSRHNKNSIMTILSTTTHAIAEGEILQLSYKNEITITEDNYFNVIYRKTAALFEASCQITSCTSAHPEWGPALATYGKNLGLCFQVIDDILDYTSSVSVMGKNTGDDLSDGKMTLPLIHAYKKASSCQKETLSRAIKQADHKKLDDVYHIITETQSIQYCQDKAEQLATQSYEALHTIPESRYKTALEQLIDICLQRTH